MSNMMSDITANIMLQNLTPFQETHNKSCRQLLMIEDITVRFSYVCRNLSFGLQIIKHPEII